MQLIWKKSLNKYKMFKKLIDVFFSQEQDFYQNLVDNYFKRDLKKDKEVFDAFSKILRHYCLMYLYVTCIF